MTTNAIAAALNLDMTETPIETTAVETVSVEKQDALHDMEEVREALKTVIEIGSEALEEISDIAQQSQGFNDYASVARLMDSVTNASKTLVAISKAKMDIKIEKKEGPLANNIFVGTTVELQQLIKSMNNE